MNEPRTSRTTDAEPLNPSPVLQEIAELPGVGSSISVRAAKAHLSALLNLVETGREITVTSGGRPKARLIPASGATARKRFPGAAAHLASMPPWSGGPTAEEIIRADRDSRGW